MAPGNDFSDPIGAMPAGGQRVFMNILKRLKAIPAFGTRCFRVQGLIFVNRHGGQDPYYIDMNKITISSFATGHPDHTGMSCPFRANGIFLRRNRI